MKRLLIVGLVLTSLTGCWFSACPVAIGDRVQHVSTAKQGQVVAIDTGGRWHSTCMCAVVYDDGSVTSQTMVTTDYDGELITYDDSYTYGWKFKVIE